ncbi:unnamed protein product, partial [Rotaria magnacalcarata]
MQIELYYGNKSNFNMTNFSSNIICTGELESELRMNMEPTKATIDSRAQIKQSGTIDCLKD